MKGVINITNILTFGAVFANFLLIKGILGSSKQNAANSIMEISDCPMKYYMHIKRVHLHVKYRYMPIDQFNQCATQKVVAKREITLTLSLDYSTQRTVALFVSFLLYYWLHTQPILFSFAIYFRYRYLYIRSTSLGTY